MKLPKIKRISNSKLIKLIKSNHYQSNLYEASKITFEHDIETGFAVSSNFKGKFQIGKVVLPNGEDNPYISLSEHINRSLEAANPNYEKLYDCGESFPILSFHMHPFNSRLEFSEEDFKSMFRLRERLRLANSYSYCSDIKLLDIVGYQNSSKILETLILQEASDEPLTEKMVSQFITMTEGKQDWKYLTNDEIFKQYNDATELNAAMINYKVNKNSVSILTDISKCLSHFAYEPKVISVPEIWEP